MKTATLGWLAGAFLAVNSHAAGIPAGQAPQTAAAAGGAPVKVGFILATLQEERYQKDKAIFEETARKLGAKVYFASSNNSEQTQAAQVDNLLSQGVQALVIQAVNGETASSFVQQAKKDGAAVVSYDRLIQNAPLDAFITEDAIRVGELQAEAAVKFTHGKGNYVILMGAAGDPNAHDRTEGVLRVLKKHPGIRIVAQQYHANWSPDLAMKTVENALTQNRNDIQAVIANNSGMARGAVQALAEQKLAGKVFVAGADSDLPAIRDIVAGRQHYEVFISIQDMARRAAETAVRLARKQAFQFDSETPNGAAAATPVSLTQ
jgi:D-xylose transport system substrate-binding protein